MGGRHPVHRPFRRPTQIAQDRGSSFKSLFDTLNHVYLAELVWSKRVQGDHNTRLADLQSPPDLSALGQAWPGLHQSWTGLGADPLSPRLGRSR